MTMRSKFVIFIRPFDVVGLFCILVIDIYKVCLQRSFLSGSLKVGISRFMCIMFGQTAGIIIDWVLNQLLWHSLSSCLWRCWCLADYVGKAYITAVAKSLCSSHSIRQNLIKLARNDHLMSLYSYCTEGQGHTCHFRWHLSNFNQNCYSSLSIVWFLLNPAHSNHLMDLHPNWAQGEGHAWKFIVSHRLGFC